MKIQDHLNAAEKLKIADIVSRREPRLLPLLEVLEARGLTIDERESLREVIADEFLEKGLRGDDEPNQYGYLLERLIDRLGHV
jgi:hypothetical protein